MSDVEPEDIQWLWKNKIALGMLTLLAGRGGGDSFNMTKVSFNMTNVYSNMTNVFPNMTNVFSGVKVCFALVFTGFALILTPKMTDDSSFEKHPGDLASWTS